MTRALWGCLLACSFMTGWGTAQVMSGPTKLTKTLQGITFDSAYDNGSLKDIVSNGTNIFNATLYTDSGEQGTTKYWFRFRLNGMAGRTVQINLDHVENARPFLRIGTAPWRRMTAGEAPTTGRMTLAFTATQDAAEVAFFEPLGVAELEQAVAQSVAKSSFATIAPLGVSTEGRLLQMVTIEDPHFPAAGKHRVWVHSRVHAGEVTASHTVLGTIEAVLADTELGRQLREHCLFTIVPVVNVDGVARGHTRWDSLGYDQEREWCNIRIPEVQALKNKVDAFMAGPNPIQVALNLHSTKGAFTDSFFFKHLSPSVSPAFEVIQQNYINAVAAATPLFNNASAQTSQLNPCLFIESYFWNNWGEAVMALTHEGHFQKRITDNEWITGADYREIGAALANGLATYFPLPAASEPSLTYDAWPAQNFTLAERADPLLVAEAADPDADGATNLIEYAFASHPRIPDRHLSTLQIASVLGGMTISAQRSNAPTDLEIRLEGSADLQQWTPIPETLIQTLSTRRLSDARAVTTLTLHVSWAPGPLQRYYRMAVTRK